jgi:hypothetical protein
MRNMHTSHGFRGYLMHLCTAVRGFLFLIQESQGNRISYIFTHLVTDTNAGALLSASFLLQIWTIPKFIHLTNEVIIKFYS